jgi:HAMP domain-containing protein
MSIPLKLIIPLFLLLTLIFAFAYSSLQIYLTNSMFRIMEQDADAVLNAASACLDGDAIQGLLQSPNYNPATDWPNGMQDSRYWDAADCLADTERYNPYVNLFLYSQDGESLIISIDSAVINTPAESDPFGTRYTAEELGEEAFDGLIERTYGNEIEIFEDGFWYIAYTPITNSNGQVISGLAAWLTAGDVVEEIATLKSNLLFGFILVYVLVLGLVWIITRNTTARLRSLRNSADLVAEGNYSPIQVKPVAIEDEVDRLSSAFNTMIEKVRGREETLKARVTELEIIIDQEKKERQVQEIADTEFFQDLTSKARTMRQRRGQEGNNAPAPQDQ